MEIFIGNPIRMENLLDFAFDTLLIHERKISNSKSELMRAISLISNQIAVVIRNKKKPLPPLHRDWALSA